MTMDENARFSLPRGATGFFRPEDGPLPETDRRAFHAGLYAAARLAGGTVGEVEPRAYPRTFHTASVIEEAGESIILCHAHHPWIVFVQERRSGVRRGVPRPALVVLAPSRTRALRSSATRRSARLWPMWTHPYSPGANGARSASTASPRWAACSSTPGTDDLPGHRPSGCRGTARGLRFRPVATQGFVGILPCSRALAPLTVPA